MTKNEPLNNVIDRSLNYGRHLISDYLVSASRDPVKVVLDLGAGRGSDLLLARAHNPACQLHAIEVHPEYQRELKRKGIFVHPLNIERDSFPFRNESVDVVMANQVLEHLKEIFWVLHEATRVLRTGGRLIIGVPNLASLHNRLLLALGKQPTCLKNHSAHVRGYTKSDLLKLLETCFPGGYSLRQFGGSNFYPFPPTPARLLASLFPNMAWGIFLMFQKQRQYGKEFIEHPTIHRLETNFFLGKHKRASGPVRKSVRAR
ncbi:MAG TPA: class I SAM-dependent methyltransferase [Bacteroidota bacterium]